MRPGLLGGAAVAPVVGVGWLLWSNSDQKVGAVIASPLAQSLTAVAGILLVLAINRERLLRRLDAWVYPETWDQRQFLAVATAALAKAERMATISRTLTRAVKRGCGSSGKLLVVDDAQSDTCDFKPADTAIALLSRTSAIVHILTEAGGSLRVHPSDTKSLFGLLPARDAAWVAETDADVIVAVPGPGAEVVGILVVGRRFDDRIVRTADVTFLEVLASAAGQAVTRLRLLHGSKPRLSEPPALECPACGCVAGSEEIPGCACGPAYVETEVPRLLAGQVPADAAAGRRWDGGGLPGARRPARPPRGGEDSGWEVRDADDGAAARGMGHGEGGARGGGSDLRSRIVARAPVPGRRVPARRHARGPARGGDRSPRRSRLP